ncbi:MAG: acetate--CoA ligase [Bdellovibrionales bacterium]|nr:acetate--CoA ligase [Bdellovibrionales bacterium]
MTNSKTQAASSNTIESILQESRRFPPPAPNTSGTHHWILDSLDQYREMHTQSIEDPSAFYTPIAEELHWFQPWDKVLDYSAPDAKWFVNGKTNLCYNCVDRQVQSGHGDTPAIVWEGEPLSSDGTPEIRKLTYADLLCETSRVANALKTLGVRRGDIVTLYMGMVPELAIAVLACARIGAAHSVIFGGFSAQAIADRVKDASSKVIITCDGLFRRGKVVPLKENVDAAIDILHRSGAPDLVQHVVVYARCKNDIKMSSPRDLFWEDLIQAASTECPCTPLDSEDMAFLLYTSGSTGKPKGILHTIGGYMVHTYLSAKYVFNLLPDSNQLYWCTADIGWITGHSYILYGILPNRVPTLMYEGAPNFPEPNRFWEIIERHKVTQFYTAPTAIRAFMKWGKEHPEKHNLSTLQVLGTVGEPINPEAWVWYNEVIGKQRCPIVDTYWQTETGGHVITPLPGITENKPGSCWMPFFGVDAAVVSADGKEVPPNTGGLLVIRKPWPGMLRGVFNDRKRFLDTYWSTVKIEETPVYTAGDGARRDAEGYFWVMGRIDDVINVSGHRLGTMEVESALVSHEAVVEAAVVGMPHEIKGTGIAAFVTLEPHFQPQNEDETEKLKQSLVAHVGSQIGAIAKPDLIRFTDALPKTRSGKIMRRLLRDIASGAENLQQDMSTLEDFSVLAKLREHSGGE